MTALYVEKTELNLTFIVVNLNVKLEKEKELFLVLYFFSDAMKP